MDTSTWKVGIVILILVATVGAEVPELTVAQIIERGDTLNHKTVRIRVDVFQGREVSSVGDSSICTGAKKEPCKLWLTLGDCRISGTRYRGLDCLDGLHRLKADFGFPFEKHQPVVIKNVRIEGVLSMVREDLVPSEPGLPRLGFGHLGAFPAEISATKINLDKSSVEAWQY